MRSEVSETDDDSAQEDLLFTTSRLFRRPAAVNDSSSEQELREVKRELIEIEVEINSLLGRQSRLLQRQGELEAVLKESTSRQNQDKKWETTDFPWSQSLEEKMKSVFKIKSLRAMQLQTMNVTLSGKDCMLIMPTGGGKSLCFQLPALLSKGITLVVSPLVSLMEDQVMALETLGIEATMLNASCDKQTVNAIQAMMLDKKSSLKLLYVTPEKLAKSKRFMNKLEKMYEMGRFSRLVIDEVHCCSQWGHDFRPDYKFLGIMKRQFPDVPILGLTATATTNVLEDVKKILNIPHSLLFKASFNRPNLYYEVRQKSSVAKEAMDEIQQLIHKKFSNQSGIIYCLSKKESEEVASELRQRGIKAAFYHADMSASDRSKVHRNWLANKVNVVVATVAFGMGIDKPDVRFVIHHSLSKSMENLYQESGRAGRDDQVSHCIVFYRFTDVFRQSTMVFTEQTGLDNLYGIVNYCTDVSKCRRAVIARHFGEVWDSTQCNRMCDHCDNNQSATVEKRDVTKLCQNVLTIVDHASSTNQRITALKLIESWQGKGAASFKVKGLEAAKVSRDKLERILAHMLLNGCLQEDFHFTAYSTNSYLTSGPKARALRSGVLKVEMNFPGKKLMTTPSNAKHEDSHKQNKSTKTSEREKLNQSSTISLKDISFESQTDMSKDKKANASTSTKEKYNFKKVISLETPGGTKETVVDNKKCENGKIQGNLKSDGDNKDQDNTLSSAKKYKFKKVRKHPSTFSDSSESETDCLGITNKSCSNTSPKGFSDGKSRSKVKKRKFVISDSDSDDLDFGESVEFQPARKKKPRSVLSSSDNFTGSLISNGTNEPICIDLNSDSDGT